MSYETLLAHLNADVSNLGDEIDRLMTELGKLNLPPGTCRWRMIDCGKCETLHGPYLYVYRRKDGQLEETYHGKDTEADAKITKAMDLSKLVRARIRELGKLLRKIDKVKAKQQTQEAPTEAAT